MTFYLAIDIGASSGRLVLGHIEKDLLVVEEIHRFQNGMKILDGHATWDLGHIFGEIKKGLKKCARANKIPTTIGIDTWGVDYVLLDSNNTPIPPFFAYRDSRTLPLIAEVESKISPERLYSITGCQKQSFNTIYQLYDDQLKGRLIKATDFLMIPEYLAFCLTGKKVKEYTNATTTGLVDAATRTWSKEILGTLNLNQDCFQTPLCQPGETVGNLLPALATEVGFQANVVLVGTHDTASAVIACPLKEKTLFISSGTWSLMGVELDHPITTPQSQALNFTNEGGYPYKIRYLKNIMGLWIIQNLRKEMSLSEKREVSFPELITLARASKYTHTFDVNDAGLLNPASMRTAIEKLIEGPSPKTWGDLANSVYYSLAKSYQKTTQEIETVTGMTFDSIHVIGGGSQDMYLNELTQAMTHKTVRYGPCEATAIGNVLVQWMKDENIKDIKEARALVRRSFEVKEVSHAY